MMRWPWQKPERRQSSFTDAVVLSLLQRSERHGGRERVGNRGVGNGGGPIRAERRPGAIVNAPARIKAARHSGLRRWPQVFRDLNPTR